MSDPETLQPPPAEPPAPAEDTLFIGAGFDFADPHSPLARFYLRPVHVAAVAVLGLLFLLLNHVPLWHTDVWGHLKFGEWVVQHGRLPDGDPFCPFAESDLPALHYSWLSQSLFHVIYQAGAALAGGDALRQLAGGTDALRFALAVLVLLRCVVLLAAFRRLTGSLAWALAGVTAVIVLSAGSLVVLRPQVPGELCFAAVLFALSGPQLARRGVAGLVLLFCLWANLHSSFAAGLLLMAAVLAGRGAELALAAVPPRWSRVQADPGLRRLALALVLSAAAVAVTNPAGPWVYWNVVQMGTHPNVLAMDEWQPLTSPAAGGAVWLYVAMAALLLGLALWRRRCYPLTALVLIAVFGLQPLRHQRMMVWWLMLAPWVALTLVRRPTVAWSGDHATTGEAAGWRTPSLRKTLIAALLVVTVVLWSVPVQDVVSGQPMPLRRSLTAATPWPVTAQLLAPDGAADDQVPALRAALAGRYPGGRFTGTVFASETLGDFFYWHLGAETPVFIYSHVHLFSAQQWEDCREVRYGRPAWRQVLDRHHVNLVVVEVERHQKLRELLREDADWVIVLDETDSPLKPDPRGRLLVALRKQPLMAGDNSHHNTAKWDE
jgi:hypothetical protein